MFIRKDEDFLKKVRNTAMFLRILSATPCALLMPFAMNPVFALSANQQIQCSVNDLKSSENATFRANWCEECSAESLDSTTCRLDVVDGQCVYSGECKGANYGYNSDTFVNQNTAHMSCSLIDYPITYWLYGGSNDSENPSSYTIKDTVVFQDAIKPGYTFEGWHTTSATNDPANIIQGIAPGTQTGALSLYAGWSVINYELVYDCANENPYDVTYFYFDYDANVGHSVPRVASMCSYPGFVSNGWACTRTDNDADVSDVFTERANIRKWQIDSDVRCVPDWQEIIYNITYKEQTKSGAEITLSGNNLTPVSYVYADLPLRIDAEPDTKIGYDFVGWCTEKTNSENCSLHPVIQASDPQPENTTLWAKWQPTNYSISYVLDGGEKDEENPVSYTIEDEVELFGATKTGYVFKGWALRDESGVLESNHEETGEPYEEILDGWEPGTQYKDKTLYALWDIDNYRITYHNLDSEDINLDGINLPETYTFESEEIVIGPLPERTGYVFEGWCDDSELTQNCESERIIPSGSLGNRDFYAKWVPVEYTITYHNIEGILPQEYTETYTIEFADIYISDPVKPGYSFEGWCDDANDNCDNLIKQYVAPAASHENIDLYAHWSTEDYSITYETNGGSFENNPKISYNTEETFTLEKPSKTGYDFVGWCDTGVQRCYGEEEPNKTITAGTIGDLVFYAQWEANEYMVNYLCNSDDVVPALTEVIEYETPYSFRQDNSSGTYGQDLCKKTGYSFENWSCSYKDANDDTVPLATDDIESWSLTYDVQCVPVWSENSFTISFNPNSYYVENYNAMSDMTCLYSEGCVLTANQYVYPGFTFVGWKIEGSEDDTIYPDQSTLKQQTEDVVLKAQWGKAKIWCDAGTYLARGDYDKCTECDANYYCPYSQEWEYNPSKNQGRKSCKTLFDNNALSLPGSDEETDCYLNCPAFGGYTLNLDHDKMYYPNRDSNACVYEATIVYTGDNSCSDDVQTYEYSASETVDLCVPDEILGRTFVGWTDNANRHYNIEDNFDLSNIAVTGFVPQNGLVTMTPVWNTLYYTLTYNCNSGNKFVVKNNLEYNSEQTLIEYSECSNVGYTFNGWYCDNVNTVLNSGDTISMPNNNVVCDAEIEENKYKIIYNGNGADSGNMPDSDYINYSANYTLDDNQFSKQGYSFDGWCTELNTEQNECIGTMYANEQIVSKLSSENEAIITLYALWTPVRYTIKYIFPNGAIISPANPTYYYVTSETFTLNNPKKQGYEFNDWCDSNNVCSSEMSVVKGTTGNLTFRANMSAIVYNINYKYVDENGDVFDLPNIEPSTYTAAKVEYYPKDVSIFGYTFEGWYTDSDLRYKTYNTGSYSHSDITVYAKVRKLSCDINQFIQDGVCVACAEHSHSDGMYATECVCDTDYEKESDECVAKEYTIQYEADGGELVNGQTNPESYTVEMTAVQLNSPEKETYVFKGWYLNPNFMGSAITSVPDHLKNNNGKAKGNVTLYAKWEDLICKRNHFIQNNTCVPCGLNSYNAGGKATSCECFDGYVKDANVCSLATYSITYDNDGGELINGQTNPSSYTLETPETILSEPVKDNYIFNGWYQGSEKITTIPGGKLENLNLTATWVREPCDSNEYLKDDLCVSCPLNSHSNGGYVAECECDSGYEKDNNVCVLKEYAITYNMNGGEMPNGVTNPQRYTITDNQTELKSPEKENYVFVGWYLNSDFSGNVVKFIPGGMSGNITLYARWQMYNGLGDVVYNCGDNVITHTGYVGVFDDVADNSECILDKGELTGWDCGNVGQYDLKDSVMIQPETITCNAVVSYANTEFNIIYKAFDRNGNDIDMSFVQPKTFVPSVGVAYPNNINIAGYSFNGWYADKNLVVKTTRTPVSASSDITVYAKLGIKTIRCEPGTYLPYDSETCSVCEENKYCAGGTYIYSATENQGEKSCGSLYPYSSRGTSSANKCYMTCEERENYNYNENGKRYANGLDSCNYSPKTYRVDYVLNGGVLEHGVINHNVYTVEMPNITSLPVPNKQDKIFIGWYDDNNNKINAIDTSLGGNITLYAQWASQPCGVNQYLQNEMCVSCPEGMVSEGEYATGCDCKPGYMKTSIKMSDLYPATGVRVSNYSATSESWHVDIIPNTWMHNSADGVAECRNKNASSTGGLWNNDNAVQNGMYCWCQLSSPYETNWVYSGMNNSTRCSDMCASTCASRARTNSSLRNALFGSAYTDGGADYEVASCDIIRYNITYDGLDGVAHNNPSTYTIEDGGLEFNAPETRPNYVFAGWTKDGQAFDSIPNGFTGDIVLTANWTDLLCSESQFIQNGVCVPCGENSHSVGGQATECSCDSGYESHSGVCEPIEHSIEYVYNGGALPDGITNLDSYTIETPKTLLNNPEKTDFVFDGWYDNPEFSGERINYIDSEVMTGNIKLYAKWDFECESGKWLRIGDNKVCLYSEQRTHPAIAIDINGTTYYIMLSEDVNKPLHHDTTRKMHVEYGNSVYNAYDASVD
jgi:uncharacterized repeat protein (TIGR02543 family)